jgi:MFS family permease
VLLATGLLTTVTLLIWWAAMSVIGGLFSPSRTLVQRMLAPPELLPELNAAVSRNFSLASVIGILGGGVVFASIGASWVYAINALSFLPLILPVIPLLGIPGPGAAEAPKRRFRDALSLLYGPNARRDLLSACRFASLNMAIGGYTITLPAIARSVSTHVGILSILQATSVVGGISTVAVMRWLPQRMRWGRVQRGCFLAVGLSVLLLAWSAESGNAPAVTLVVGILAILPLGFALSLDRVILSALVQMRTPPQSRAEFFTYYALIPMVAVPVGQMAIGALADQTSVSVALAVVAAVTLVLVVLGPRLRQRAGFDELTLEDSPPTV